MGSSGVASVIWVVLLLHFVLTRWNYIAHAKAICPGDESGWLQRVLVLPASAEALMGTAASNVLLAAAGPLGAPGHRGALGPWGGWHGLVLPGLPDMQPEGGLLRWSGTPAGVG